MLRILFGDEVIVAKTEAEFDKKLKALDVPLDELEVITEKRLIKDWETTARSVMIAKANKLRRDCGASNILIAIGRRY